MTDQQQPVLRLEQPLAQQMRRERAADCTRSPKYRDPKRH
jgi:hypothetical protein